MVFSIETDRPEPAEALRRPRGDPAKTPRRPAETRGDPCGDPTRKASKKEKQKRTKKKKKQRRIALSPRRLRGGSAEARGGPTKACKNFPRITKDLKVTDKLLKSYMVDLKNDSQKIKNKHNQKHPVPIRNHIFLATSAVHQSFAEKKIQDGYM